MTASPQARRSRSREAIVADIKTQRAALVQSIADLGAVATEVTGATRATGARVGHLGRRLAPVILALLLAASLTAGILRGRGRRR
ncbi:MAG: hypothetical protein R2826_03880 [Thermoleophilia bacterium]